MQFRPEAATGPGYTVRRPGAPPFPAGPPFRGGFPVDHGPRVDDRRHHTQAVSRSSQKPEDEEAPPSRHLWVGNVSQDISEEVLMEKFSKFGEIESVTVYSQRNYAFINFRREEDAVDAKNGLQGVNLGGLSMRIEFAKGVSRFMPVPLCKKDHGESQGVVYDKGKAKPSRHLWAGGISQSVSKEEIEGEFKSFGTLEDFKFLRDLNCAFIDYARLEDAVAAVDALNRKRIGDEELRVDYGRSQPPKRESGASGARYQGDERGASRDRGGSASGSGTAVSGGGKDKDGEPSEVLWVGFPLYAKVDEEGLRRAFIQFGEIERIKTFPGRTYAFVQFRSVEEATRAKDGLEGKLFNDPRVHIRYSKSEIGPVDNPRDAETSVTRYAEPMVKGVGPTRYTIGSVDRLGANSPVRPTSPSMRLSTLRPDVLSGTAAVGRGIVAGRTLAIGPGIGLARALGRGVTDSRLHMEDVEFQISGSGRGGVPSSGLRPGVRHGYEESWDLPDDDLAREQKRPRIGGLYSVGGVSSESASFDHFDGRRFAGIEGVSLGPTGDIGNASYGVSRQTLLTGDDYGASRARLGSHIDGARPVGLSQAPSVGNVSGFNGAGKRDSFGQESGVVGVNEGWRWHGTIAKGGTPVCRARCFPVGKGIDVSVPDVVNCTARTDLDMLAKHVYQAGDFGVVFFVPEADPDVPPYQDFMHYLGEKHRAGVAKLGDGTTLFLVPPSEFSERVLKVPGNDCLFGVVLKQPSVVFSQTQQPPQQQQASVQPSPQQSHQQFGQVVGPGSMNGPSSQDPPGFRGPSPPLLQGQQSGQGPLAPTSSSQLAPAQLANLVPTMSPELIASLTALLPQQVQQSTPVTSNAGGGVSSQFPQVGAVPSGATIGRPPAGAGMQPGPNDGRTAFRPPQSAPPGWSQFQHEHSQASPLKGGFPQQHSAGMNPVSEQSSMFQSGSGQQQQHQSPQQQQQQQNSPLQQAGAPQSLNPSILGQNFSAGLPPGFNGHFPQQSRPGLSAAPQLPADQLAQLTALLTQRQQQPAQQQAAHLLQQHFHQQQHQQPSAGNNTQQPPLTMPQQGPTQQGQPQQPHSSQPMQSGQLQSPSLGTASQPQWGGQQQPPAPPPPPPSQPQTQQPQGSQQGANSGSQVLQHPSANTAEQPAVPGQASTGGEGEVERQKRFQATLQLAAALLHQMQQQEKPRGGPEQR